MNFIINLIHDQVIEVLFFPTEDQVADIFTKSLPEAKLVYLYIISNDEYFEYIIDKKHVHGSCNCSKKE
jgi:hypothetical protein